MGFFLFLVDEIERREINGVVVTIVLDHSEQEWVDLELPSESKIADFLPLLADVIGLSNGSQEDQSYILEMKLPNGNWRILDSTRSLDDYQIMDGAYLRVQKKTAEEYWHDLLSSQLEMISKEKLRKSLEVWRTDD